MERYGFGPAPRRLRAQLRLDYADGSHEWVVTGPDWRLGASPILKSDIYNGETIDARLNTPGWDRPAFDAATWNPATGGAAPPVRVDREGGGYGEGVSGRVGLGGRRHNKQNRES